MDRVLQTYAHSAWTPADPLHGIDPEVRRAILLMPSTFRERWKLAPWTGRHQRQLAIRDIVAERRLLYELTHRSLAKDAADAASTPATGIAEPTVPASPYYRYRLALSEMRDQRAIQDRADIERLPEARQDYERRSARHQALLRIGAERARLDARELDILSGHVTTASTEIRATTAKKKRRADKVR